MNLNKKKLAHFMCSTGINNLLWMGQKLLYGSKYLRVINYHCTPESSMVQFEQQLQFYKERFTGVDQYALARFLSGGEWDHDKPGLIISFDDGLRCNQDFAISLIEKYGFTGWFMVPVGFVNTEVQQQERFMQNNKINCNCQRGNMFALNWPEIKKLQKRGHVICCHTMNHLRLYKKLSHNIQLKEIHEAKIMLEENLGNEVLSFAWVGGEEENYNALAGRLISESGYSYSFTTNAGFIRPDTHPLSLGRINIESNDSLDIVKFQLSGSMDLLYYRKRQRVNRLIEVAA